MLYLQLNTPDADLTKKYLSEFKKLAKCGKLPTVPNLSEGHADGWGLASYRDGKLVTYARLADDAFSSPEYEKALDALIAAEPTSILCHLRKASKGSICLENTHPFISDTWSFMHNGTVKEFPATINSSSAGEDATDSEVLFKTLLEHVSSQESKEDNTSARIAYTNLLKEIHNHREYTSISSVVSNGSKTWIARLFNDEHPLRQDYDMDNYYTLYLGNKNGVTLVSSEPIGEDDISWKLLDNGEIIEIDSEKGLIERFSI